jgi:2'-5' RNA ligase
MEVPLILTLALEEKAFTFFNALRKIYFPPERNFIDAHLTLFHHLPNEALVTDTVKKLAAGQSRFILEVREPKLIGNGVAYKIECPALVQLHKSLQEEWSAFLIPQDKQRLWPHVTVQNKVPSEDAKQLLLFLQQNFSGFTTAGVALQLWEYHRGPWKLKEVFALE